MVSILAFRNFGRLKNSGFVFFRGYCQFFGHSHGYVTILRLCITRAYPSRRYPQRSQDAVSIATNGSIGNPLHREQPDRGAFRDTRTSIEYRLTQQNCSWLVEADCVE